MRTGDLVDGLAVEPGSGDIPRPPQLRRGDALRVTHLADMRGYEGGPVDYPAGDVAEGIVRGVDPDGFFEVVCAWGETRGYFLYDPTLRVERIDRVSEE
jgi:hypothetical protein